MGITLWYFVRSDTAFQAIPLARVDEFFDGSAVIPARSDRFVYLVEVAVSLHARRAVAVERIGYFKHRVLASGALDRDRFIELARVGAEGAVGGVLSANVPGVVDAGHRFARRRYEHAGTWTPADSELRDLRALVNRKAGRPLL